MPTLHIQFTRPQGGFKPLSSLIRVIQGTPYSHVRLHWVNSSGVPLVYEASRSSVSFQGPLAQKNHPVDILDDYSFELDRQQYRKLVEVCMTYAGIDYGKLQLVGIGIRDLLNLEDNPFADGNNSLICSELVGRVLLEVLHMDICDDFDTIGPKELHKFLRGY